MDDWQFPIGTKVWKEFSQGDTRLETRLLWKTEQGWFRMAFVWNQAQTEAVAAPRGEQDVLGTEHDVPQRADCLECHQGRTDMLLGVSALQLAHDGEGITLASLIANGLLSDPPSADLALPDEPAWNALGYLHSNCGSCHNPLGRGYDLTDVDLWLHAGDLDAITNTVSYQSTVNVALTDTASDAAVRIAPEMPELSGVIIRMRTRGSELAMPPLASERVDDAGVAQISSFIEELPNSQ
jgi:mono/diheme cytochrome c family protein